MTAKQYQKSIQQGLEKKLSTLEIKSEWAAFSKIKYQYSPRVDIAVGPFSTTPGENKTNEYNQMLQNEAIDRFLRKVYDFHVENVGEELLNEINIPRFDDLKHKNRNARCFLAIEIENTSSKKHIMGSMVNATSLGRIGIGVAYNDSVKRTFLRILNYLAFLKRVEKNTYDTTNFLILTKEQLISLTE